MSLEEYHARRRFERTPEPRGRRTARARRLRYAIQKHDASRLHFDLRLELDGVMKSWAVPRGPSLDPRQRRLAVAVEDHPVEYAGFEGAIPAGEYGAGQVIVWDRGTWEPLEDPHDGLRKGRLPFAIHGEKLRGEWLLVRTGRDGRRENWLLIKRSDDQARAAGDIAAERPESVLSGRTLAVDRAGSPRVARAPARSKGRAASKTARAHSTRGTSGTAPPRPTAGAAARNGARRGRSAAAATPGTPAPLPERVAPQLATLVKEPPVGDEWLHEMKFDGYRILARIARGTARLITRNQQDWSGPFASVARAAAALPVRQALLDGEVVALGPDGISSFQALQNVLRSGGGSDLVYFVFDLLHLDGRDLTREPLERRKELLRELLARAGRRSPLRYSDHQVGRGPDFFRAACARRLEGIVSKRRDGHAIPARTRDWVKTKCTRRQECVIGGWSDPAGARQGLGALLLGVHDEQGRLHYCGKVGTGFTDRTLRELKQRLTGLARDSSPFTDAPRGRTLHWVEPRLVAEIAFTEWTADGRLRHPSFQGLREDKPAQAIRREREQPPPGPAEAAGGTAREERLTSRTTRAKGGRGPGTAAAGRRKSAAAAPGDGIAGVRLTHPERVLYRPQGITKQDLARYYEQVADRMIPEIRGRPLMLKRCPQGAASPCFFQKHPGVSVDPALVRIPVQEARARSTWLTVQDAAGLVALVQLGVLEVHVWGARHPDLERPDRMVFDLDPGPRVAWGQVVELARRLHRRLEELKLRSFLKTTGGKGLHIVVPLTGTDGWDEVRGFSEAVARQLARDDPGRLTLRIGRKHEREDRILIDTLRNARGSTWVAPYSTRARPGAPVSVPVAWSELRPALRPDQFTVASLPARLARQREDPWRDMARTRQRLTAAMRRAVARAEPDGDS